MAARAYVGTARPVSVRFENDPRYRPAEWDDPDASVYRGYEKIASDEAAELAPDGYDVGALVCGGCVEVSPARQALLEAANTARAATEAQISTFKQSLRDLRTVVKNNSGTVAQQAAAQRSAIVKLITVALGTFTDD